MSRARQATCFLAAACYAFAVRAAEPTSEDMLRWQREDIQVLRDTFLSLDRSFTAQEREAAESRLAALGRAREPLTPAAFAVELCRIAALADNGHTQCMSHRVGRIVCERFADLVKPDAAWCRLTEPDFQVPEFASLPLGFYPFGANFHVVAASTDQQDLLGARLISVEGRAVEEIRDELRSLAGGTAAFRDLGAAGALARPMQLQALGLANQSDAVTYELELRNGQRVTRRISLPIQSAEAVQWRRLRTADAAPWSLREPDKPFRFRDAPEAAAVVIQLRQILDAEQKILEFLEDAQRRRQQLDRPNVILDMRENGGGNLLLTRDFMRTWPSRVKGHFYVLTSPETFSAAIASIGYLKQAGGDRVSIIGEPVGDRLVFFSDGLPIQLPHSGLFFLPAVLRMDFADGCRKFDDCFEAVAQPGGPAAPTLLILPPGTERLPIAVGTLDPDVSAPWTIDDWISGTDSAMKAVVDLERGRDRSPGGHTAR